VKYAHACEHPRYGFTVHSNGIREAPGPRSMIDRARTSWNVIPRNSRGPGPAVIGLLGEVLPAHVASSVALPTE
jgi:hypothetical protein